VAAWDSLPSVTKFVVGAKRVVIRSRSHDKRPHREPRQQGDQLFATLLDPLGGRAPVGLGALTDKLSAVAARSCSNPAQAAPNLVLRRLAKQLPTSLPTAFVNRSMRTRLLRRAHGSTRSHKTRDLARCHEVQVLQPRRRISPWMKLLIDTGGLDMGIRKKRVRSGQARLGEAAVKRGHDVFMGTRVPAKQGCPPMTSGSSVIAGSRQNRRTDAIR
jgi:hypothetical protein